MNNIFQQTVAHSAPGADLNSASNQLQSAGDALPKCVGALTQSLDKTTGIQFSDLFEIESIQRLQDQFSDVLGVASIITEVDGTPITKPSNFTRLCSEIIRNTELGRCNCFESDAALGSYCPSGPIMQPCLSGGLWDAGASITVDGKHIASWLIGQVRNETQDEEKMFRYSDEIGVDREVFRRALAEVPIMSTEHFQRVAQLIFFFAQELSNRAYQIVQQAHYINERKEAEEALRDAEAFSVSIRDSLVEHLAVLDSQGVIIAVNRAWQRFAEKNGASGPLLNSIGMNYLNVCEKTPGLPDDKDAEAARKGILAVLNGATREFRMDYPCHSLNEQRWFQMNVTKLKGSQSGAVVAHLDITARKQAEEELFHSKEMLQIVLDNIPAGVFWKDRNSIYLGCNSACASAAGLSAPSEIIGKSDFDLSWKASTEAYQSDDRAVMESNIPTYNIEESLPQSDGRNSSVITSKVPLHNREGNVFGIVGTFEDITKRKAMEEQLLRDERIDSIGRLAAGVAHDLNNVLTPIMLSAEMLPYTEDPDTRESLISSIAECAKRGADVVNQVLTFARGSKGERTKVQLNPLVNDVEKIIRSTFPKNIDITSDIPSDLWPVKADATQIHQIFLNLCINARDAMPEGGSLLITGENVEIDENFAAMVSGAKEGDYAMLSISDSGTGIPQELLTKIFDPFFTTKGVGRGTGLGLSTVIGIVRSHVGFVSVQSEPGHGATFKVFLPRETGEEAVQRHFANLELQPGNGETILVVDDEVFIAKTTALVLEKNGYKVLTAAEGTEALALYREHANAIALVLTDVIMPGMGGVQLAQALNEINPQVKIIASTGQASENRQAQLQAVGVKIILRKPYDTKKLLATLNDAIHAVA